MKKTKYQHSNNSRPIVLYYCLILSVIIVFLSFCSSKESPSQKEKKVEEVGTIADYELDSVALAKGKELFEANCSSKQCHGLDLKGKGGSSMNLTASKLKFGSTDKDLVNSIINGRPGTRMNPYSLIGEDSVNKIIAYIKSVRKQTK